MTLPGSLGTASIRTLALVGAAASGKTTLLEALLHKSGAIGAPGSVERGSTVSDFDPLERKVQHSLASTVVHLHHLDSRVHLIDTPGSPDFLGHSLAALEAVETAAVAVSASAGIEMMTARMMEWAGRRELCRLIIVNKIDAERTDLPRLLQQLSETFGKECLPLNLPAGNGTRVVDCFFNPDGEADFSSVQQAHRALVEQVVEVDAEFVERYLNDGDVDPRELHAPLEQALREGHLIPVCFVSARNGAGIAELLDVLVKLMPHPGEGNPPQFLQGEGPEAQPLRAEPDPQRHVLAHVFKITVDPYVGKMGVFRIYQGTVTRDSLLYVGDGRKPFKVGHLFLLQGKDHVEIPRAGPGEICAVAKVDELHFDAVLHDAAEDEHIHLKPLDFPLPVHGLAIEPRRRGDEQRLWDLLQKLVDEDPCLRVQHVPTTNETVVYGLGELHLRSLLDRLTEIYKCDVNARPPRIAYQETITGAAEGHHRHKKQTGGAGQFGEVYLRVEALPRSSGESSGFEFIDQVKGGTIPTQFIPAVEKGVRQVLESGVIAGYPVKDVRVTVYDGKHHSVDSKEIAFVTAGRKAFIDAVLKAGPIVLEPIVDVEITAPESSVGDITGDLAAKRAQVAGTRALSGGVMVVLAQAPLSELNGYQSRLNAMTGGQGRYTITLSHYDPVPPGVQQQLVGQYRVKDEE
ncbi:elongation factor G [Caldimonas brevitalea]|uniref:Elongation factor G n=1 Tax=Caldimonas brevitalea TaxID=413882 RepID=A0A0G3BVN4_9BURK|nr:elongation factor G [Caldimonas brevitalea]AKJ31431.1 elongation factor G [Caldimonas brevitalea]